MSTAIVHQGPAPVQLREHRFLHLLLLESMDIHCQMKTIAILGFVVLLVIMGIVQVRLVKRVESRDVWSCDGGKEGGMWCYSNAWLSVGVPHRLCLNRVICRQLSCCIWTPSSDVVYGSVVSLALRVSSSGLSASSFRVCRIGLLGVHGS